MVIQAVELILALRQAFNVLSTPMLLLARSFIFSWKSTQPALFNCVALGALKSFAKFTGKHLWQSLSFDKLANYSLAALFKKRLQHRCFSVNFMKFLRTAFSQNKDYCFCNKTSTETSFKNDDWWMSTMIWTSRKYLYILSQHQASSFFRSFLSFRGISNFVIVDLGLSFSEFSFKDYSAI